MQQAKATDDQSALDRPIAVTRFKGKQATVKKDFTMTPREMAFRILNQSAETKEQLPWLKLAAFGNRVTDKGSFRNNDNVLSFSGLELDYDQESIPLPEAHELLEKAGIAAILYTSPSHMTDKPRWRVLAPFSEALDLAGRTRMANRINGLFNVRYGGQIFDPASWTPSQAFYYGYTTGSDTPFAHKVMLADGDFIDFDDKLDETAVGKPGTAPRHKDGGEPSVAGDWEPKDWDEIYARLARGEDHHNSALSIVGRLVAQGWEKDDIHDELMRLIGEAASRDPRHPRHRNWKRIHNSKWELAGIIGDTLKKERRGHIMRDYDRGATEAENDPDMSTDDRLSGGDQTEEKYSENYSERKSEQPTDAPPDEEDDAAAFKAADIPKRPWLIPRLALRQAVTAIIGAGAAGKSTLATHIAIMGATGEAWGGWTPRKAIKTYYINLEDPRDEKARRFIAIAAAMGVAIPPGMITVSRAEKLVVAKLTPSGKAVVRTPVFEALKTKIMAGGYDNIEVDPFIETHEVVENDNKMIAAATAVWRDFARETNTSVILVHHARKGVAENGAEAEMARGASGFINVCRCGVYMATMRPPEAEDLGLPKEEAKLYVSVTDAKQNYAPPADKVPWFKHASIDIGNGQLMEEGDSVGALTPWEKPGTFGNLDEKALNRILDAIARGMEDEDGNPTGQLYTAKPQRWKDANWAGKLLVDAGRSRAQAKEIIAAWIDARLIVEDKKYTSPDRKSRTGLRVVNAKRPGAAT